MQQTTDEIIIDAENNTNHVTQGLQTPCFGVNYLCAWNFDHAGKWPHDITWVDIHAKINRQLFIEFSSRTRNVSEVKTCVSNMLKELQRRKLILMN